MRRNLQRAFGNAETGQTGVIFPATAGPMKAPGNATAGPMKAPGNVHNGPIMATPRAPIGVRNGIAAAATGGRVHGFAMPWYGSPNRFVTRGTG